MSLPPVNATTVALHNSPPGTTDLFGKMILGVGIGGAVICLGAVIYSKMNPDTQTMPQDVVQAKGGKRRSLHNRRAVHRKRNGTRKA